jgi:S1-C subfamily serine protease
MRGITSGRWSWRKRLTTVALLAIAVLVATDLAGGLWPFASFPPLLATPTDGGSGMVTTDVIYAWRGLLMQRVPATDRKSNDGLLVEQVEPDSPAARAKLKPGDIITALDGISVNSARSLAMAIADHCCGPTVSLSLWQDHQIRRIELPPVTSASEGIRARTVERGEVG